MKAAFFSSVLILFAASFLPSSYAQTDELRSATGLPIPIGEPAIFGRVTIRGLEPGDRKPRINVLLFVGGVHADRKQANDDGYYYFLTAARDGAKLVFEADGIEVGNALLTSSVGITVRRDITIDWQAFRKAMVKPGVVSARLAYPRSEENEHLFQRASAAGREKKLDEAISLFNQIVANDPKDFVAWTELGTLYSWSKKDAEAEAAYNRALEQKPDFMVALINLGRLYFARREYDKAADVFFKAVSTDPTSADAFHYLGESYLQAKVGSKAVIALNEAIRLAPQEKAELHLRLAALYNAAGVKDRAANEYKLFLAKRPDYPEKEKLEKYIRENSK